MKQIQINENTFVGAYKLILRLDDIELDKDTRQLQKTLKKDFESKLKAIEKRKVFTEYKTALPDSVEREEKRQKYIEIAKISQNWKSEKETYS